MKFKFLKTVLCLIIFTGSVVNLAQATPIRLDATQFTSQTSSLTETLENFTSYHNTRTPSLTFSNATFTGVDLVVVHDLFSCGTDNWCLVDFATPWKQKTFDALQAGTQFWATDFLIGSGAGIFDIKVTGGSGILALTNVYLEKVNFISFFDALGIFEISFVNKGIRNGNTTSYAIYGIDNVRTAGGLGVVNVPEPATLAFFGLGLFGFRVMRQRKAG